MKEAKENKHVIYLEEQAERRFTKLHNHGGNMFNKINTIEEMYLKKIPEILEATKAVYAEVVGNEVTTMDIIEDLEKRIEALEKAKKEEV